MVDESEQGRHFPSLFDRSIWKFYEWGVVLAPVIIMLSHWYIFYVFSKNTQEVMKYPESNEICIAWIYSILYLYVPLMILPASYFFQVVQSVQDTICVFPFHQCRKSVLWFLVLHERNDRHPLYSDLLHYDDVCV